MNNAVFRTFLAGGFFLAYVAFSAVSIVAQTTYTTIANGNWTSTSTWQGGSVPPTASTIPSTATINIRHTVNYNTGNQIKNDGVIRIQPTTGTTARLTIPSAINIENFASGDIFLIDGSLVQCRFVPCNDGQSYSGTSPGAPIQSGTFKNIGGYVETRNSYVEIAQDWTNESNGTRIIKDSCVKTGQNFSMSGSGSVDILHGVNLTIGWHGSGNFQSSDGNANYQALRVQLAGTSGSFQLNSGTINGDIDYIYLRNHIVPFNGGGLISASSSVTTSGINLDAYCSPSLIQNGKFTGSRTSTCALPYFPGDCPSGGAAPVVNVDLSIAKSVNDSACVVSGQTRVFTLTATNLDDNFLATNVVVNDLLPAGLIFISSSGNGSYNSGTGVWTIGDMTPGQVRTRTITVQIPSNPGTYTNTASYGTLEQTDPVGSNNSSQVELTACVTAGPAAISGSVLTADGIGIKGAIVQVFGGGLEKPIAVATNSFGRFRISGLPAGSTYVVVVSARRFQFSNGARVISLTDDFTDADFVADDPNRIHNLGGRSIEEQGMQRQPTKY